MKLLLLAALLILFTSITSGAFSVQSNEDSVLLQAPVSQSEIQDTLGEELSHVLVDQQVLIVADVTNALDRQLPFAYIVQIQDEDDVVVSLGWLAGSLSPNQVLSPALSWTPQDPGAYHATIFVWEGIDNPVALSHTLELQIDVRTKEA